ncbi:MAG: Trm112 family protein [Planctomycetota bacterium]
MSENETDRTTDGNRLDPAFLELLCCPCPARLPLKEVEQGLFCTDCERVFPVIAGIPGILLDPEQDSTA